MKKVLSLLLGVIALLFSTSFAFAQTATPFPKPTGYINDYANVLSSSFKQSEEQKLTNYTKQTTNEIAVVTVQTTGDASIDEYGQALADQWKPGVSGKDNGVIILFAMQDHHDRIQIGCGLEGNFTDVQAQAILDNDTQPLMKAGKYDQAVDTTVNDVENQIKGATLSPCTIGSQQAINQARANTGTGNNTSSGDSGGWSIIFLIILGILIIGIIFGVINGNDDDGFGSGFTVGTLLGGIGDVLGSISDSSSGGGFGGFSGGSFSGGGASGSW